MASGKFKTQIVLTNTFNHLSLKISKPKTKQRHVNLCLTINTFEPPLQDKILEAFKGLFQKFPTSNPLFLWGSSSLSPLRGQGQGTGAWENGGGGGFERLASGIQRRWEPEKKNAQKIYDVAKFFAIRIEQWSGNHFERGRSRTKLGYRRGGGSNSPVPPPPVY